MNSAKMAVALKNLQTEKQAEIYLIQERRKTIKNKKDSNI